MLADLSAISSFSRSHWARIARLLLVQLRQLASELVQALLARRVGLLLQRLLLDLQLHHAALDGLDLERHRVDLHLDLGGGLVDQVDGLVGQEAVGDVAIGQHRRCDQRRVLDADAVVHLVALAQPAQDVDRVLHAGLAGEDRLEAARERRVLLDVLAVFVERRGADAAQLAARERGLEHVARVHRAFGARPRP